MRNNLGTVIRFEIVRNLKKPTFWIAALLLPVLLVGYIGFAGMIGYNTNSALEQGSDTSEMTLGVHDAIGYLNTTEIENADGSKQQMKVFASADEGIAAVKAGELGVFYYIPADFATTLSVRIYAMPDTTSIFNNYEAPIRNLLMAAAQSHIDPVDFAVVTGGIKMDTTNFATGTDEEIDPVEIISRMVVPGVGLALFYILIVMFGNRLTTAMVEEKENRISEIILTAMRPVDLITGKIISLIALGFIQLAALIVPVLILYLFGATQGIIPEGIVVTWDAWTVIGTVLLLMFSYFLFTALCITIGTLVPTAKDASSFASVVIILVILPLFFISSFMSDTPDALTYILSYFPPSAPIALMFRNVFGTLPVWELGLGLLNLAVFSALIIKLAVFIFKRSALDFTSRVNLKSLMTRPRSSWKEK